MVWRFIEKKVKNSFYPDLYYWSANLPRTIRTSVYKKHGLNIRFEIIPEFWPSMLYFWYFGKLKGHHYPTDNNIKFFYFTLFKKNGFIFIILCYIIYRNCFFNFFFLLLKSGIAFYLIVYLIFIILLIRKFIRIILKILYRTPLNCIPILIIINFNDILNKLKKKE